MGLSIECAELQELFLWKTKEDVAEFIRDPDGQKRIKEELADVFVFLLYLSYECNIDLSDAIIHKLAVNEKKYPVSKSFNSNKKYTDLE